MSTLTAPRIYCGVCGKGPADCACAFRAYRKSYEERTEPIVLSDSGHGYPSAELRGKILAAMKEAAMKEPPRRCPECDFGQAGCVCEYENASRLRAKKGPPARITREALGRFNDNAVGLRPLPKPVPPEPPKREVPAFPARGLFLAPLFSGF